MFKLRILNIVFTAVVMICFAACSGSVTQKASLGGTKWMLYELEGVMQKFQTGTKDVYIQFDETAGQVSGFASCNTYSGAYTVTGSKIKIGPLISTKMACDDMKTEMKFMQSLNKAVSYKISSGSLSLMDDAGIVLCRLRLE